MSVTSVRRSLDVVGQSASIRELIRLRNEQPSGPKWKFPLSLRKFVGALPPGSVFKKVISLDLLQRKLDEFFNNTKRRPLFKIRLDNISTGDHRHSTVEVFFDDPARGYITKMPDGKPHDLGQLEIALPIISDPDFHFSDFSSDSLRVKVISGTAVDIEVLVHFEPKGTEMIVNNFFNIDLAGFNFKVVLSLALDSDARTVDFLGWLTEIDAAMENVKTIFFGGPTLMVIIEVKFRGKAFTGQSMTMEMAKDSIRDHLIDQFIQVNASVNAPGLPDGQVASGIENKVQSRILEGLTKKRTRDALKKITTWLVGGDFPVIGISNNERELTIEYLVPPGQLEPFPEKPQPSLVPGRLINIDHIVVLMMENRSFDTMLGYLRKDGKRQDVDGLRGGEKESFRGSDFPSFPFTRTVFPAGPCHESKCVKNQVNGEGFVADYAKHREKEGFDPGEVMGHYTAAQLPIYDLLAKEFLICERWFSSHPGPTFPNRFYTLTGRPNRNARGKFEDDNPHRDDFIPVSTRTIFDHLNDHAVWWRYYETGYCFLRMFGRYTFDDEFVVDMRHPSKGFLASAAAGTLPSVSFIDPDFIDVPPGNDDAPPADIVNGQRLVAEVVQAVMNGPKWDKTLLVITYDEHGGFYDHVAPLAAVPFSEIKEYGVRVPTFVVSPWVDRRKVSNITFDHTSIAKTIARRFMSANPPDMGERMAAANDLSMVLRSTPRKEPGIVLPRVAAPKPELALQLAENSDDDQDFKAILRSIRARHPIRK